MTRCEKSARPGGPDAQSKVLGIFGGASSGLGAFGAAHSVCHYACQGIVAALALVGISIAGMPLAFLLDPRLVVLFSAMGLASAALGIAMHRRTRKDVDKKLVLFGAFVVVSAISLIAGVRDMDAGAAAAPTAGAPPQITVDAPSKTSESGGIRIEMTFQGVSGEGIAFEAAFDSMSMDAPPLDTYGMSKLARLAVAGGATVSPSSWAIRERGHMGHHVRGRLVFPASLSGRPVLGPGAKYFELRFGGVDGEARQVFSWNIVAR